MEFIEKINQKRAAGFTAFMLEFNTNDRYFNPDSVKTPLSLKFAIAAAYSEYDIGYFSQSTGLMPLVRPGEKRQSPFKEASSTESPSQALNRGFRIVRGGDKRLLIIDFMDFLAPNASNEMLHPDILLVIENFVRAGQDDKLRKLNSFLIGVNYSRSIHELIRRNWYVISIPLPSESQRLGYYKLLSEREAFAKLDPGISESEYLLLSRGARLRDIENLLREAYQEGRYAQREDFNTVREATLSSLVGELLVVRKPSGITFDDVCGMDSLKRFILKIVKAVRKGRYGLAPGGLLLQGPPGTGKTFVVDAIAAAFDYPILEWRNLKSMWLGQSEANLEAALSAIEAMSPVVVFIDEADQILSGRQEGNTGDSGTSGYMFGRLLNFMGDGRLKGRVIWILASNRPDLIDPALADRVGCCVPLLRPGKSSIPVILRSLAKQLDIEISVSEQEMWEVVKRLPQDVSMRKLKELVGLAALYSDGEVTGANDFYLAVSELLFNEDRLKIAYWTYLAVRMASYATLLPWRDGEKILTDNIPVCLEGVVNPNTGEIDREILDKRIYELSRKVVI